MSDENRKVNPNAFIAIGVCFMGAGVTLGIALGSTGASKVGIPIVAIGVIFLVIGATRRGKMQSKNNKDEEQSQLHD
jgi:hypothetical protein